MRQAGLQALFKLEIITPLASHMHKPQRGLLTTKTSTSRLVTHISTSRFSYRAKVPTWQVSCTNHQCQRGFSHAWHQQ